jgi:RNase adapter protein RapZ
MTSQDVGHGMGAAHTGGPGGNAVRAGLAGSQPDNRGGATESGIDVVLVTGLSGAGRGTAAKVLEDLGWYVADNLPPQLITRMVDFGLAAGSRITQLAVVMDVRSRGFTGDLDWVRNDLATRDIAPRVLFMEASDDMLVRRYEQNRRSHPLQGEQTLAEGIAAEREMLAPVRATADLIIDTSALSVRELRESIERAFGGETVAHTSVTVESFGFKYGLPMDADMVMDVRFLPNPHWVDELRPHTGQHPAVRDYVLGRIGAAEFLKTYHRLLSLVVDGYRREGKRYMTVAIGCTGGKHRSVAIAEALAGLLEPDTQLSVRVLHRDLGRE